MPAIEISDKSRLAALLLCIFLGFIGVHRFYVGKRGTGILQVLTPGGLGLWWLADFILIEEWRPLDRDGSPQSRAGEQTR